MNLSISILVDDMVTRSMLLAEHGFSAYIELDDTKILFDSGQGMVIKHNAKLMGIKLHSVDTVVMSHGHYDHANGIKKLFNQHKITVYAHPLALQQHYKKVAPDEFKSIGIDWIDNKALRQMIEWQLSANHQIITPNVILSGQIPRQMEFEEMNEPFFLKEEEGFVRDGCLDDQALFIRTESGIIILTGCAHSGLINTILHARRLLDDDRILAVVGGTHLIDTGRDRLQKTADYLDLLNVEKLFAGHCTGFDAGCFLKNQLNDRFQRIEVGMRLEWGDE